MYAEKGDELLYRNKQAGENCILSILGVFPHTAVCRLHPHPLADDLNICSRARCDHDAGRCVDTYRPCW